MDQGKTPNLPECLPAGEALRPFMSQAAQNNRPRGPIALVAADPALYARACTYAALVRATLTIGVFRDLDRAEEWLTALAKAMEQGGA